MGILHGVTADGNGFDQHLLEQFDGAVLRVGAEPPGQFLRHERQRLLGGFAVGHGLLLP
jgi:hypothetical protein